MELTLICKNGHSYSVELPAMMTGPCSHTKGPVLNAVHPPVSEDELFAAREWLQKHALDPTVPMPILPDGLIVEDSRQTELVCGSCGGRLSVVGDNRRTCPRCGNVMQCMQCAAEAKSGPAFNANCRLCGEPPIRVEGAPRIEISGIVTKVIG